jgi:hypothetical protein
MVQERGSLLLVKEKHFLLNMALMELSEEGGPVHPVQGCGCSVEDLHQVQKASRRPSLSGVAS